jgi:transposase
VARRIDISLDGLHQLLHRIERKELADGDWAICGALVLQLITRTQGKQERMAVKLAATAGNSSAEFIDGQFAVTGALPAQPAGEHGGTTKATDAGAGAPDEKKKVKGHGRKGASAFVNAKHVVYALAAGLLGALCSACGLGRMTRYREKVVIRVVGQPLFAAELHHLEQARCRVCGRVVRAEAPPSLLEGIGSSYTVYDWSACAMLVVMHYFAAAPFKRLESLHEGWGIPLADANLWRVADETDDLLLPLYRALELYGIQNATTLRIDDTGSMVVTLARQIQAEVAALELVGESTKAVRTGINATGVFLETTLGAVVLFFTGRHHAGEVLELLLERRVPVPGRPPLVKVTDGASKNFDHQHRGQLVEASCNAHAFLKFHDIKDKHPAEYAVAGEVYKAVFDNDDEAKSRRLTPDERMLFHRERSKPLMEKLKAMCEEKLRSRVVEPSSALWEPLTFIINQWSRLTRFYEAPGVPLDTNVVEQKLIIPVRYLSASFNYQTETGAEVGDRMMSLLATAHANGVEPVAYLTHCLRHHEDLSRRPADYLPWLYRDRERSATGPPTHAARPAGC